MQQQLMALYSHNSELCAGREFEPRTALIYLPLFFPALLSPHRYFSLCAESIRLTQANYSSASHTFSKIGDQYPSMGEYFLGNMCEYSSMDETNLENMSDYSSVDK